MKSENKFTAKEKLIFGLLFPVIIIGTTCVVLYKVSKLIGLIMFRGFAVLVCEILSKLRWYSALMPFALWVDRMLNKMVPRKEPTTMVSENDYVSQQDLADRWG